jgi:hypothetical protein
VLFVSTFADRGCHVVSATVPHAKLALTSPTGGGRPVGIVHLRTTGHRFFLFIVLFVQKVAEPKGKGA